MLTSHDRELYLRSNVQVDPLFDSWYAWSHLIPPATAARNITERHLPIMESYIASPQVHAAAVKNPKLLGGPFIDYDSNRVEEVIELLERTKRVHLDLIQLSEAISALDNMLRAEAKGFSLQPLYEKVPPALRGYVELIYDTNNSASFRIIEPLLYTSGFYKRSAQKLGMRLVQGDERPFVLSTPRLSSPNSLELSIPFDDERIDWLFSTKRNPQKWKEIVSRFEIDVDDHVLLASFFTESPPKRYERYTGSGARWRYFGHACILVETANISVLFDPVLSYTYESHLSRYTYDNLPDLIDFVVITHNHQDHILFETLLQIRHKVGTFVIPKSAGSGLVDPSLKLTLQSIGCKNVIELDQMESLAFENGSITGLPFLGEHADLDIQTKLGYLLRLGKQSLLFLADSCNLEPHLYERIHEQTGDVDAIFLGMECDGAPLTWAYGPLFTQKVDRAMDRSRRLAGSDYGQAINIVERFRCKDAYVYAMGQEPWLNYVMSIKYAQDSRPIVDSDRLISTCRSRGIAAERLFGEKEILL